MAAGKSQKKFQHLTSKQETEGHRAANQLRAREGASSSPPTEDSEDDIGSASFRLQRRLQTPPTCDLGPPAVQLQPHSQSAPQEEKSVPAHHSVSLNAPGRRKQPKTVPNILSRSKDPAWPSSSEGKTKPNGVINPGH